MVSFDSFVHSRTSRDSLEQHQIQKILKTGLDQTNDQLSLMAVLVKRNQTKSFLGFAYGKKRRHFTLDF